MIEAHDNDADAALAAALEHFRGAYTVGRMVEDHIDLLTGVGGYTLRRYRGMLDGHVRETFGSLDAAKVKFRDVVGWIRELEGKGLASKTIRNINGLVSAA